MNGLDGRVFADTIAAARIAEHIAALETPKFLRFVIENLFAGRIALVSSFGADAAVLLHMVSRIDEAFPVIFVDTLQLFPQTLAYRDSLIALCGLSNVITLQPDAAQLAKEDPDNFLWAQNPDRCCHIRKVEPLAKAMLPYAAWITGRKRFEATTRAALPFFESEGERVKINPLARWTEAAIEAYFVEHDLPRHELFAKGYFSIGCVPCTSPVKPGEDPRAGRWRGSSKTECGIHFAPLKAPAGN
ncbi:MAG: phosphoadenylyl-sulfate reductase [Beijerinckiaceae bacterium]